MPQVKFTSHLWRFFPNLKEEEIAGETVADVITALNQRYPDLASYLVDEQSALRQYVNIFIGNTMIRDWQRQQDPVTSEDQLFIFQALSGG